MKLFMLASYEDWNLRVCKDQAEAECIFYQINDCMVDGGYNRVFEVNEIDGYDIQVRRKLS